MTSAQLVAPSIVWWYARFMFLVCIHRLCFAVTMPDLTPLVELAQQYDNLLAGTIKRYQRQHQLDDLAMVEYLQLGSLDRLELLCLCERPSSEFWEQFLHRLDHIARYVGCNYRALIRVVRMLPTHCAWQQDRAKRTWSCSLLPYHAVILEVKGMPSKYAAYVHGPRGKTWAPDQFGDLGSAQDWCELALEAFPTT